MNLHNELEEKITNLLNELEKEILTKNNINIDKIFINFLMGKLKQNDEKINHLLTKIEILQKEVEDLKKRCNL